ncbi:MAG: toll/interleukin-1 receptor domain-containing protein [Candidatus Symbiobacter sp.]|nr:toll/interleukin-1 receptor domain-containing protein [Candidatus Symbiobacter sp.]
MVEAPKIFISYSHDSDDHKAWVLELATSLRGDGVNIILDRWDIRLGGNIQKFMEENSQNADRVLIICSSTYVSKANLGKGGVGYEKLVLTDNLMKNLDSSRLIPVIFNNELDDVLPAFLSGRKYIDFRSKNDYEVNYSELLHEIHGIPRIPHPPLGQNPISKNGALGYRGNTHGISSDPKWLAIEEVMTKILGSAQDCAKIQIIGSLSTEENLLLYIKKLCFDGKLELIGINYGDKYYGLTNYFEIKGYILSKYSFSISNRFRSGSECLDNLPVFKDSSGTEVMIIFLKDPRFIENNSIVNIQVEVSPLISKFQSLAN